MGILEIVGVEIQTYPSGHDLFRVGLLKGKERAQVCGY